MFALIDCNNFYASCERLFNPKMVNRPVVVLSNNDGCVIARSNEAKTVGIKMGQPMFEIKDIVERENVAVFSSNYTLYGDLSTRVMQTIQSLVDEVEVYSIDEAFADLTGFVHHDLTQLGDEIRNRVFQWVGIPVSVGIAPTKTLAKIANHIAKKQKQYGGVCILRTSSDIEDALKQFPIEDVWGVGRRIAKHLQNFGVKNAYDFSKMNEAWVRSNFTVTGLRMVKELNGYSCIPMSQLVPPKKTICTSRSFGKMVKDYDVLAEAVANYAARCGEKLRKQKSCANMLLVFVNTNPFRTDLKQYTRHVFVPLPVASSSSSELIHYALLGLQTIFKEGYSYKKAGVIVSEIVPENQVQQNLFDEVDRTKQAKLMATLDLLNSKMGRDVVRISSQGTDKKEWKLRRDLLSPSFTTQWTDILEIDLEK